MVGILNGVMTALGLLTFVGIVWWAFSAGRVRDNQEAAMLPFQFPDEPAVDTNKEGSHE